MKTLLVLASLFCASMAIAQSFTGLWKGTVTRDYGTETVTDSLLFEISQDGDKITGFSVLFVRPGEYIRSVIDGSYLQLNQTLTITETKIDYTNIPDRGETFFLDRYLLICDANNKEVLTGKCIPNHKKAIYTRSKVTLKKMLPAK